MPVPGRSGDSSGSRPASWASDSSVGISISASGFPAAPARSRSATAPASRSPCAATSSARASAGSSGPISSRSSQGSRPSGAPGAVRTGSSSAMPSARSRRPANSTASSELRSSHCASSSTSSSGRSSAAPASRLRTPAGTAKRSCAALSPRASAPRRAAPWVGGIASRRSRTGASSSDSPAKGMSDSLCMPRARSTRNPAPAASATACSSSAVFPMPASPTSRRVPLRPSRAAWSRRSTRARSGARPTSISAGQSRCRPPARDLPIGWASGAARRGRTPRASRRRSRPRACRASPPSSGPRARDRGRRA